MMSVVADDVLLPADVARLFKSTDESVRRWAKAGLLPSFRTPGGQLRFYRADVERFLATGEPPEVDAEAAAG